MKMISAKFLWANLLFGGKQQIDAKKSNFKFFESAIYMKSVSMPLSKIQLQIVLHQSIPTSVSFEKKKRKKIDKTRANAHWKLQSK